MSNVSSLPFTKSSRRETMKVCILSSSYPQRVDDPVAAAGLFVQSFARAVAAEGCKVTVITQDRGTETDTDDTPGLQVVRYPWLGNNARASYLNPARPRDALRMWSLVSNGWKTLRSLHAEVQFDHVIAMWAAPAGYLARKLNRLDGTPYTVWCLGSDIWTYGRRPFFRGQIAKVVRDAAFAFADGLQLAADAQRLGGRDVRFLPSSRHLDRSLSANAVLPGTRPQFVFVGRYAPAKGVDVLLEAFGLYRKRGGSGTLHVFGGGPDESAIRARSEQPDLKGAVLVNGYANEETVVTSMSACDVVVIPSRIESVPVVLSDAVQMGRPVVVADVGDMGQLVREHRAGCVVPAENPMALCQALERIATNTPSGHYAQGVQGLASRFDISTSALKWIELASTPQPDACLPTVVGA